MLLPLVFLFLAATCCLCLGTVTAPLDSIDSIRITPKASNKPVRLPSLSSVDQLPGPHENQHQSPTNHHGREQHLAQQKASPPRSKSELNVEATLNITEPPPGSYVMGSSFSVAIHIQPQNREDFMSAYEDSPDAKMCVKLDSGPHHCWPALTGRIFYSHVTEGEHTLEAMLYAGGELKTNSKSSTSFTLVRDPDLVDSTETLEAENESNKDEDASGNEQVQVSFPIVEISSPAANVTYPGTSVSIRTKIEPTDADSFKHFFENAFVCSNVDSAPAYSCYAIFGDDKYAPPLILGLPNGMHTIEAALSHPETGELLPGSSSGKSAFFTAGELNEAATIAVEVTVAGDKYIIPLVEGSSLASQTKAFCQDVGHADNPSCTERILHKLYTAWENKVGGVYGMM